MIAYLPEIYPDELVYSWFCRYYVHSGFLTHNTALRRIYCKRSNNPSKEFLGQLNNEMLSTIQKIFSVKSLVLAHTMFPQYARFIPKAQKETALNHICNDYCDVHHLFSVLPRCDADSFLRFCPICADEDRRQYGETYWHRNHQIRGVKVCCKHGCILENSSVSVKSELSYTFCPAEEYVNKQMPKFTENTELIKFAAYLNDVFNADFDFDIDTPIQCVLYGAMSGTRYMKLSGKTRNTQRLANDIKDFYQELGMSNIASLSQIQRVLSGNRVEFLVLCQMAYFLGLSVDDLIKPEITQETIKLEQDTHYMKDKRKIDWGGYDVEILPRLEQVVKGIYYGTSNKEGRPERVSKRMVYREFGLSRHRLKVLPKCRDILDKYSETYEENWARRIIWAYNRLKSEKNQVYWSDIRKLSGVKKDNIKNVILIIKKNTGKKTFNDILKMAHNDKSDL